jgi:hypothetical protein
VACPRPKRRRHLCSDGNRETSLFTHTKIHTPESISRSDLRPKVARKRVVRAASAQLKDHSPAAAAATKGYASRRTRRRCLWRTPSERREGNPAQPMSASACPMFAPVPRPTCARAIGSRNARRANDHASRRIGKRRVIAQGLRRACVRRLDGGQCAPRTLRDYPNCRASGAEMRRSARLATRCRASASIAAQTHP